MARRPKTQTLMLAMGGLVLALGVVCAWVVVQNARPPEQPSANERAVRQVREQRGRAFEVRYAEAGRGRALCGYAGPRIKPGSPADEAVVAGRDAIAFVSRPNRILFSDDPLPVEFRDMQRRFCPGFLVNPQPGSAS